MISNGHALTKAVEVLRICNFTSSDTLYSPLPLFYSMGLLRGVLSVALVGSSIALRDKFSVSSFWDDVRAHNATVAHCVFSIPKMLAQAPVRSEDRDNPLRCMFNAQHDPDFEERFGVQADRELRAHRGRQRHLQPSRRALSCPARAAGCRTTGRSASQMRTAVTCLWVRPARSCCGHASPASLMLGYLNKPEMTAVAFRDLWFHTGDLARRDADGHSLLPGSQQGRDPAAWPEHLGLGNRGVPPHAPGRRRRRRPRSPLGGRRRRSPRRARLPGGGRFARPSRGRPILRDDGCRRSWFHVSTRRWQSCRRRRAAGSRSTSWRAR